MEALVLKGLKHVLVSLKYISESLFNKVTGLRFYLPFM